MEIKIIQTSSKNNDFIELVKLLDEYLAIRDGKDHTFYHQFNSTESLKFVTVLYAENIPVSCGAMKVFDNNTLEIKRMYTLQKSRGKGYSSIVLKELEQWAKKMNFTQCILETGKKQPEAISLYKKFGYVQTDNYEPYIGIENSFCFKKRL